ncbi:MAG: M48 family metallopeptidase [Pseudomonadota bacterium]
MLPESEITRIAGRCHPPDRSVALESMLEVVDGEARLLDGAGALWQWAPIAELRVDGPLGRLERKVIFPDGTVFLAPGTSDIDAALGRDDSRLHDWERFHPRLIGVIAAAILGAVAVWRFGLPILVAIAVWLTPGTLLRKMDAGTLATIDAVMMEPTTLSDAQQAPVKAIFDDLLAVLGPTDPRFVHNLQFRDAGPQLGPNALALPGGTVVVTDELAKLLVDDPDAMAGILAHELVHVEEAHGLTALYRSLALYVLVALIAGDTGPLLEEALLEGNVLLSLAGSRAAEEEADAGAVPLTRRAGYDPIGLARFMEIIAEEHGGGGGWLSTHPDSHDRAAAIRALAN